MLITLQQHCRWVPAKKANKEKWRCVVLWTLFMWKACFFRKLEEALKAMQTSLPLVLELHHPAMRPRHWKQLMKVHQYCSLFCRLLPKHPLEEACHCACTWHVARRHHQLLT